MPFDPDALARRFVEARRSRAWLGPLSPDEAPGTSDEAYAVQDRVAALMGPIVAWKVGAPSPAGTPIRAPIFADTLFTSGAVLPASLFNVRGAEGEIAVRFARDLPNGGAPYDVANVLAAIGSIHPAIEFVDTRFQRFDSEPAFVQQADQGNHGALIIGDAGPLTANQDWLAQAVSLTIDGIAFHEGRCRNAAGDLPRLLVWLANVGAASLGGLRAGQFVTTGSCTGTAFVEAGVDIAVDFARLGHVQASLAPPPATTNRDSLGN